MAAVLEKAKPVGNGVIKNVTCGFTNLKILLGIELGLNALDACLAGRVDSGTKSIQRN